jgi:hypothetical protein
VPAEWGEGDCGGARVGGVHEEVRCVRLFFADLESGEFFEDVAEEDIGRKDFALGDDGVLAWTFRTPEPFFGGGERSVIGALDRFRGEYILSSRRPAATKLRVTGRTVSWRENGAPMSVDLPRSPAVTLESVTDEVAPSGTIVVRVRTADAIDPRARVEAGVQGNGIDFEACTRFARSGTALPPRTPVVLRLRSKRWCGPRQTGSVDYVYGDEALECNAMGLDCFARVYIAPIAVRVRG